MTLTVGATGTQTSEKYMPTESYILNYHGLQEGVFVHQYLSAYKPTANFYGMTNKKRTGYVFNLYNTKNQQNVAAYCMDVCTETQNDTYYRRMNLEDSVYSKDQAGKIRSIVLKSFPNNTIEKVAQDSGIEGLTVCEAVMATQLAVWEAVHREQFEVVDFVKEKIGVDTWKSQEAKIMYYDQCNKEFGETYTVNVDAAAEERIEALYKYLTNLAPTNPEETQISVSNNSFKHIEDPVVTKNADGTYNVTVTTTVNVNMANGDSLTLSAVVGDGTYYAKTGLNHGENTVTLTVQNIPSASVAYGDVKLAIDGMQTVSGVYLFDAQGNRESSQTMVGVCGDAMPVHAQVVAEQEREIYFYKSMKMQAGTDEKNEPVYTSVPLSGITFDLYLAAELDEYLTGAVTLPATPEVPTPVINTNSNPNGELVEPNFPDYTVTTDANGEARVSLTKNNLPDGVYIVVERDNPAIIAPVAPFYIMVPATNAAGNGLDYVVNITPKNQVIPGPQVDKDVISVGQNSASVDVNKEFSWIISGDIPVDMKDATMYQIVDELDYRLTFGKEEDVVVKVESADVSAVTVSSELERNVDYTLAVGKGTVYIDADGNKVTEGGTAKEIQTLTVQLTAAGMDKVAEIAGDQYEKCKVRVYFNTTVDSDAAIGENIPNDAILQYTSSVGYTYTAESDDPYVYTCGIHINKYDAKDHTNMLEGARFKLYKAATVEEMAAGTAVPLVTDNGTKNVVEVMFYSTPDMTGDKVNEVETSADDDKTETNEAGVAYMYGLEAGEYYLVETKAPADYNLLTRPITVTLNETKRLAVEGVANSNQFQLPETGGIGTTIFKICGVALIAVAVVVLVVKKKKEKDDEEE